MCRLPVYAALFLALAGCSAGQSGNKDNSRALSEKQKTRWEKIKKEKKHPYMIVGYLDKSKDWQTCVYDSNYLKHRWESKIDVWQEIEKTSATNYCRQVAAEPGIVAIAFLDLFSYESPHVIYWFYTVGDVVKISNKAPKKDLEESLNDYLHYIQTVAD